MTFPQRINATVTIAGVDVTDFVDPTKQFKVNNVLTKKADTCNFTLERAGSLNIHSWDEITVTDGSTLLFAGYITDIDKDEGADLDLDLKVSATDYTVRLEKVIVKEEYSGMTDAEILQDIFTKYVGSEGYDAVTFVSEIKTHTRMRFNRITLLACITKLADLAGADFYIDYEKRLHFFETDTASEAAPFSLSDDPDLISSMPYSDLSLNQDGTKIVNRVEVIGGNYRSNDTTFYLPGTGQDKRILLPFKMHAPDGENSILIYRNDGTQGTPSWTQLTVKAGYIDSLTGANEVLYYYQEKVIEQQSNWPDLPNAVKIVAKYEVPLRTRVSDDASIAHYGLVFDGLIVDDTITDKSIARMAALAKLSESSMETEAISLDVAQPGLRAGQVVHVTNAIHGINASYLIQKVATTIGIAGAAKFDISLGTYNSDLIDLMLTLSRQAAPKVTWREDEVLDEILQRVERLLLSETSSQSTSTGPYYFSEDPAQAFLWGFGAFQS